MKDSNIFKKACLIQLATSCWVGAKMLQPGIMEKIGDSEWLKGRKLLINPELLGPIKTTIQKARQLLMKHALPFPLPGLFLVPKENIADVDGQLALIQQEFASKAESFSSFYEEAREEAKIVLGTLFSETDYPVNIRTKFRFDWRFLLLDVPGKASILTPEIYEREKEKFQALMEEARELSVIALREEFQEVVAHMVERLNGNGTGKPKTIKSNMVNRINEFLDSFGDRNLFNDEQLSELVTQARTSIAGVQNTYALNYNEVLRKRFSSEMSNLKTSIDLAIEDMPRRRIRMNEAEALAA